MLDNILNIVTSCAQEAISGNAAIATDKKDLAVTTTATALTKGLEENFNLGNLASITELFSGGSGSGAKEISNSLQSMVSSSLAGKVGIPMDVATSIASTIVPMVINGLSKSSADGSGIEGIIEAISGVKNGCGVLGHIGNFFG